MSQQAKTIIEASAYCFAIKVRWISKIIENGYLSWKGQIWPRSNLRKLDYSALLALANNTNMLFIMIINTKQTCLFIMFINTKQINNIYNSSSSLQATYSFYETKEICGVHPSVLVWSFI